jgi:hypothetical protein
MLDSINVSLQVETVSKFKRHNIDQNFRKITEPKKVSKWN